MRPTQQNVLFWFTGQSMSSVSTSETDFCKALAHLYFGVSREPDVRGYAPPVRQNGERYWAKYVRNGDVDTCETEGSLSQELWQAAGDIYEEIEALAPGSRIIFAGTSNGAVPAFEFAQYYSTTFKCACVLVNGCPSVRDAQLDERHSFFLPFPLVMAMGIWDTKFWRQQRTLYTVAWRLQATTLPFPGYHSSLPSPEAVSLALGASRLATRSWRPRPGTASPATSPFSASSASSAASTSTARRWPPGHRSKRQRRRSERRLSSNNVSQNHKRTKGINDFSSR